jgi:gamma-glutamyl:cysteine ligase YbdK (ATP-grasp superfamily)
MGEEIKYSRFTRSDHARFEKNLKQETGILVEWFAHGHISNKSPVAGYELEAWLIDAAAAPCPENEKFMQAVDDPMMSPELAKFNVELNVEAEPFNRSLLRDFEKELLRLWNHCKLAAATTGCRILGIGTLPTLMDQHLSLDNISSLERYRALNEQVLRMRRGQTIRLLIDGHEHLEAEHENVMLEAASTSLQIHLQTPEQLAVRYYNASLVLSAPMVAVGANSPFLFGKDLWAETRIPVFEQSVPAGGIGGAASGPVHRVSFGTGYARDSLLECFIENLEHFPVLLPVEYDSPAQELRHLRLHNGTIWRWNRPLIGFDSDGTPHLRIEHRVLASGASVVDNIANLAFYYGLVQHYANREIPPETRLTFAEARDNFYRAARFGLAHKLTWTDGNRYSMQNLVLERLLLEAEAGLYKLGIAENDIHYYLGVIENRVYNGSTGSEWQRRFVQRHGRDMQLLTQTYYHNQQSNRPVHEWDFETT